MKTYLTVPCDMRARWPQCAWLLTTWAILLAGVGVSVASAQQATLARDTAAQADSATEKLQQAMKRHVEARTARDLTETINLCEQALQQGLDPQDAELAHQIIASCLLQRAQATVASMRNRRFFGPRWEDLRDRAIQDLKKAIEHVPQLVEAHKLIYELCLLPGGDRQLGMHACDEVIRLEADKPAVVAQAYAARARFQDNLDDQLADLHRAAEADPENHELRQTYGLALIQAEKFAEAEAVFQQLTKDDPQNPQNYIVLSEVLLRQQGRLDDALAAANRAVELDQQSTQALLARARVHLARDDAKAAMADVQEATKRDPKDVIALLLRGELFLHEDNAKAALEDAEAVLRLRPGLIAGILLRARALAAAKRFDEAVRDMELLVQNDPQNPDYKLQLAFYHMAAERPRKAIKLLTEILEANESDWRALRARGDALLAIGKHAEAIQDYNRALKLKPDDSGLLNNLAWVLATSPEDHLRDGKRALELALKACELTHYKEAHILSTLASAYAELGDFENAIKWSTQAVELGDADQKEQLKKELETYQQGKPFREKQETQEKPEVPKKNLLET